MRARYCNTQTKPSKKHARVQARADRTPRGPLNAIRRNSAENLRAFQRAMPNVHVKLRDLSNKATLDGVHDGRLQLGLIARPPKASARRDVQYEELFHERVCLAVAPKHPFARRRSVPLTEAVPNPSSPDPRRLSDLYDFLSVTFATVKQKPRIVEQHDSFAGVFSAVEAGTGVAIGAELWVQLRKTNKILYLTPSRNQSRSAWSRSKENSALPRKDSGSARKKLLQQNDRDGLTNHDLNEAMSIEKTVFHVGLAQSVVSFVHFWIQFHFNISRDVVFAAEVEHFPASRRFRRSANLTSCGGPR